MTLGGIDVLVLQETRSEDVGRIIGGPLAGVYVLHAIQQVRVN